MNSPAHIHSCQCHCCAVSAAPDVDLNGVTRRRFIYSIGALAAGGIALSEFEAEAAEVSGASPRMARLRKPLRVQPVLTYEIPKRREATSWRSWGGIQTEQDASKEKGNITAELAKLKAAAEFPLEILPVAMATNLTQAAEITKRDFDVTLLYAAGGGGRLLESLTPKERHNIMFVRHDPGPVYLWYEIAHPHFLRKATDKYLQPGMDVTDVVVDDTNEILWRLRALHGLSNTLGKRIVAIGGAGGWGEGLKKAPAIAQEQWKFEILDFPYRDLEPRLKDAMHDTGLVKRSEENARKYLRQSGISLHTDRSFVNNAFVLTEVFKDLMDEAKTDALTIQHCMGTIMGMSKTTACLPLSLLNDDNYLAFCESDFVVIPSGVLLHYISGKPVFLNDPTYPHGNIVTLAHCTAPRKMDGKKAERTKIYTHFESDYGAAPKVEMRIGQVCTNLVPDFANTDWVGFKGTIVGNPFLDICRSQIDVRIDGDCAALLSEMKGFHWMTSYGSYLKESSYALRKIGVKLRDVSTVKTA